VNSFVALIKEERYHETSISENLLIIKKEHLMNYPIAWWWTRNNRFHQMLCV